jgi:hypothetical protein
MYNPQDSSGVIQAAIKNLASNNVFYFSIPVSLEVVFAAGATMEVAALATAWKGIEESQEASVLVNGTFHISVLFSRARWCVACAKSVTVVAKSASVIQLCLVPDNAVVVQTCPRWTLRQSKRSWLRRTSPS